MHMKRLLTGMTTLAIGLAVAACSDAPSSPAAPRDAVVAAIKGGKPAKPQDDVPDFSNFVDTLSRTAVAAPGTQWKTPLTAAVSASAVIGAEGGWLEMPQTGFYMYVPAGTVAAPTTFSVTAQPGKLVAYDFQPAGSVFKTPVFVVQDKNFISTASAPGLSSMQLGYFRSETDLNQSSASATVSELRSSLALNTPEYLAYPVWHFSGYIVCWGRASVSVSVE
jgi:hypothetical protein